MRLWSLHPKYLDTKGLVALWREGLLARHVLAGKTKGYRNHPQLDRFREQSEPVTAIDTYLVAVYEEACRRGFHFDPDKTGTPDRQLKIPVSTGQVNYETEHLKKKLADRDPERFTILSKEQRIALHPLFYQIKGGIESWEKIS